MCEITLHISAFDQESLKPPRRSCKSWHHTESRLNSWFNPVHPQCSSLAPLLLLFIILLLLPRQVSDSSPQRLEASISSPVRPINNVMNHWAELLTGSGRKTGIHLRHVLVSEESSQTFLEPRIPGVDCKWYADTLSSPDRIIGPITLFWNIWVLWVLGAEDNGS